MAKKAVCDTCETTAELEEPYGLIPDSWFRLQRRGEGVEQEFCSVTCLMVAVTKRMDALPPAGQV